MTERSLSQCRCTDIRKALNICSSLPCRDSSTGELSKWISINSNRKACIKFCTASRNSFPDRKAVACNIFSWRKSNTSNICSRFATWLFLMVAVRNVVAPASVLRFTPTGCRRGSSITSLVSRRMSVWTIRSLLLRLSKRLTSDSGKEKTVSRLPAGLLP